MYGLKKSKRSDRKKYEELVRYNVITLYIKFLGVFWLINRSEYK